MYLIKYTVTKSSVICTWSLHVVLNMGCHDIENNCLTSVKQHMHANHLHSPESTTFTIVDIKLMVYKTVKFRQSMTETFEKFSDI